MTDVLVVGGIFREVLDADTVPRLRYGGSGLTASIAAARFGASVALASYVGAEDEETVRAELQLAKVDDSAVLSAAGASGTFLFPAHYDQSRPWPMYRPAEAIPHRLRPIPDADVAVVFGIPDCDPVELGWVDAGGGYKTIIWDRQGWLSRARDDSAILKVRADRRIYVANELETIEDARVNSLPEALAEQPPQGFDAAVIKRGTDGVIVVETANQFATQTIVPAFPVCTDTTIGSGDVFAGVLAAHLASGDPIDTAARWSCAAAAVSLTTGRNLLTAEAHIQARKLISKHERPCDA